MSLTFYVEPDGCSTPYVAPSCVAPGTSHTAATMTVVNVREFIDACYPTSPTPAQTADAIRCAAASIPEEGGILYFPAGEYLVELSCLPISIKSRTWVRGAGRASILKGTEVSDGVLLWIGGVRDVTVSDMMFDMNHGFCDDPPSVISWNFKTSISIGSGLNKLDDMDEEIYCARNITINNCVFRTSGRPERGQTLHAVLAEQADGLFLRNNLVIGQQFNLARGAGVSRCVVEDNIFEDPYNLAISLVLNLDNRTLTEIRISRNTIINVPSSGGIFLGTDGTATPPVPGKRLGRVLVSGNILRGLFGKQQEGQCIDPADTAAVKVANGSAGIVVDVPEDGIDLLLADNILENTDESIEGGNTCGIIVQCQSTSTLKSITITGNTVRNFEQPGIRLNASCVNVLVDQNCIDGARGIEIKSRGDGIARLTVANNNICGGELTVVAVNSHINALIEGNLVSSLTSVGGSEAYNGIHLVAEGSGTHTSTVIGNSVVVHRDAGYTSYVGIGELGSGSAFVDMQYVQNSLPELDNPGSPVAPVFPLYRESLLGVVRGNKNVPTVRCGLSEIVSSEDEATVSHGLTYPNVDPHVTITPTEAQPGVVWLSAAGTTTFTVSSSAAASSDFHFAWRADRMPT